MRAVIQRVAKASVLLSSGEKRAVGKGLVVLLGVGKTDSDDDALWMAGKTARMRIFSNTDGKFDLSVSDISGDILVVSQFTLYGDARKGNRPDFSAAAAPDTAVPLYESYVAALKKEGLNVLTGSFGDHMEVELLNDGPVTIIIESGK